MDMAKRETIQSRLGFLLLSAGCAIGLGNVWRFPFITGKYGGAVFLLAYLVFLMIMGLPILVMEFAVGRAARLNMGGALGKLGPGGGTAAGSSWRRFGWQTIIGSYLLMMFYIPVAGWMVDYMFKGISGALIAPTGTKDVAGYVGGLSDQCLETRRTWPSGLSSRRRPDAASARLAYAMAWSA